MKSKIETEAKQRLKENAELLPCHLDLCSKPKKKKKQPPTFALKCPCCGKETKYFAKLNAIAKVEVKSQKSEGVFQLEAKINRLELQRQEILKQMEKITNSLPAAKQA